MNLEIVNLDDHSLGPKELSYNYLNIAFAPFDDYWKEVRKLAVQELFSTKQVNSIQPIKDEEVKKLIDSITESASQNTPVNLNKKCLALTVSVVCRTAFGVSFEGTVLNSDRFNIIVREALEMLGSFSASDFIPYVGWIIDWFTGLQGRRERSKQDLNAFYEQIFDLHKEGKKQGSEDFVDFLLRLEKEEAVLGNDKLTRNHIKAILLDVLLAGIDTSAISMTWAMAELAKNPRVMKKVQSEIRSQIKNKERISFDDTDKLEYLKMVIKETWRPRGFIDFGVPNHATVADALNTSRRRRHRTELLNQIETAIDTLRSHRTEGDDLSLWKLNENNFKPMFSSHHTWQQIRTTFQHCDWHKAVWFQFSTPKYAFITWLAFHDRLATGEKLRSWNVGSQVSCVFCGEGVETQSHLFFSCPYSSQIWSELARGILRDRHTSSWSIIIPLLLDSSQPTLHVFTLRYVFQITIHSIWRERNRRRHGEQPTTATALIQVIDKHVRNRFSTIRETGRFEEGLRYWFHTRRIA